MTAQRALIHQSRLWGYCSVRSRRPPSGGGIVLAVGPGGASKSAGIKCRDMLSVGPGEWSRSCLHNGRQCCGWESHAAGEPRPNLVVAKVRACKDHAAVEQQALQVQTLWVSSKRCRASCMHMHAYAYACICMTCISRQQRHFKTSPVGPGLGGGS